MTNHAAPLNILIASPLGRGARRAYPGIRAWADQRDPRTRIGRHSPICRRSLLEHPGRSPLNSASAGQPTAHGGHSLRFRGGAAELPVTAPRLRWVQATSSGIGEFLKRTGLDNSEIMFTTAAGVHSRPLTEFTLLGLLYFFRDVPQLEAMKARKHWERYTVEGLEGKRVLVVGLGAVGREVARQCASFGMDVWGTRRRPTAELPEGVTRLVDQSDIRTALPDVDALVLACPLTPETKLLIGAPEVAALKKGAVLVNIARGGVIDEPALIAALTSGRMKGAALDVFATEPLPQDNPLWTLPNVIFSPHSASTVHAENRRIVDLFLDNLQRYRDGTPLRNLFDRERGY